jgi:endonuclease G
MHYKMLPRFAILCIALVMVCFSLVAQTTNSLEIPKLKKGEEIIRHASFSLVYSEKHEQAKWVAYTLTKEHAASDEFPRKDNFIVDPMIKTGSAHKNDYHDTPYDKGHLCPADDNKWSKDAMHDCFYMSNMSPQTHSFNAGIWKSLEAYSHNLALENDTIYIVTGPVLKTQHKFKTIGENEVSVPEYFYKVVLVYGTEPKAWGYIIPHTGFTGKFNDYACSVDEVERKTGIDFYSNLDDWVEKMVERKR